jgi:hypothetical protein
VHCREVVNFAARVSRDGNTPWLTLAPPRLRAAGWGSASRGRSLGPSRTH